MEDALKKAGILIEALPYIKSFYGETLVIKYGGSAMVDEDLREAVAQDVALMRYVGIKPVLVHGGGPEISELMKRLGKEATFVDGLRVTDRETVEIAEMVLAGKINKEIVSRLGRQGARAVGLSGKDGQLFKARKHLAGGRDIGYVGDVESVDPSILNTLVDAGYIPVVAPTAFGDDGENYNINADAVAGAIAGALKARKLILLTDVEGIMKDGKLISTLSAAEAEGIFGTVIGGGMIPKVRACLDALNMGAREAHIIDGRLKHSLLLEVFTDSGIGTMVRKGTPQ